jgi:hypothetical protein
MGSVNTTRKQINYDVLRNVLVDHNDDLNDAYTDGVKQTAIYASNYKPLEIMPFYVELTSNRMRTVYNEKKYNFLQRSNNVQLNVYKDILWKKFEEKATVTKLEHFRETDVMDAYEYRIGTYKVEVECYNPNRTKSFTYRYGGDLFLPDYSPPYSREIDGNIFFDLNFKTETIDPDYELPFDAAHPENGNLLIARYYLNSSFRNWNINFKVSDTLSFSLNHELNDNEEYAPIDFGGIADDGLFGTINLYNIDGLGFGSVPPDVVDGGTL